MVGSKEEEVRAILAAAYAPPQGQLDQVAEKVRARLALMETIGETFRLLIEVPGSALSSSLIRAMGEPEVDEQEEGSNVEQ